MTMAESSEIPFYCCKSRGGPFDDDAFIAGYETGQAEARLRIGALIGVDRINLRVGPEIEAQVDLACVYLGYTRLTRFEAAASDQTPGWVDVTYTTAFDAGELTYPSCDQAIPRPPLTDMYVTLHPDPDISADQP